MHVPNNNYSEDEDSNNAKSNNNSFISDKSGNLNNDQNEKDEQVNELLEQENGLNNLAQSMYQMNVPINDNNYSDDEDFNFEQNEKNAQEKEKK